MSGDRTDDPSRVEWSWRPRTWWDDATIPRSALGRFGWYLVAFLVPAGTLLPSLARSALPATPPAFLGYQVGFVVVLSIGFTVAPRAPTPLGVFVAGLLAAVAFPILGEVTLGSGAEMVTGSLPVLADIVLTWVAAYALAAYVSMVVGPGIRQLLQRIDDRYAHWASRRRRRFRNGR